MPASLIIDKSGYNCSLSLFLHIPSNPLFIKIRNDMITGGLKTKDEVAVCELVVRLSDMADSGPLEEYMDLFTEDAFWRVADTQASEGKAMIKAGTEKRWADKVTGPYSQTRHIVLPTSVKVDGDTATVQSVFQFYNTTKQPIELVATGVYDDTYKKEGYNWKLNSRQVAFNMVQRD